MDLSTTATVAGLSLNIAGVGLLAHELFNGPPAALKAYWDRKHYESLQQEAKTEVEKVRSARPSPTTPGERRQAAKQRKKDRKFLDKVPKKMQGIRDAEKALSDHLDAVEPSEIKVWKMGIRGFGLMIAGLLLQAVGAIMG